MSRAREAAAIAAAWSPMIQRVLASPDETRPSRRSSPSVRAMVSAARSCSRMRLTRCERLKGTAEVEAQVDRLLLRLAGLGEMLDGRQRLARTPRRPPGTPSARRPCPRPAGGTRRPSPTAPPGTRDEPDARCARRAGRDRAARWPSTISPWRRAAPVLEQAPVGHLVGEGVLERVLEIREEAASRTGTRRPGGGRVAARSSSSGSSAIAWSSANGHVLPDHRRGLEERLVLGRQPVDAGGQHGLHRGRDLDGRERPRQPVGAALARRAPRSRRASARSPPGRTGCPPSARSASRLSGSRPASGPSSAPSSSSARLRRQRVQPELRVVGPAAPGVLILRPVVHEEQEPRGRQALDERVEQRLGLGVDPVEVLEDDQERLHLALPQQEPLHRVQGALATLRRIERRPTAGRRSARRGATGAPAGWPPSARSSVRSFPVTFSRTARGSSRSSIAK